MFEEVATRKASDGLHYLKAIPQIPVRLRLALDSGQELIYDTKMPQLPLHNMEIQIKQYTFESDLLTAIQIDNDWIYEYCVEPLDDASYLSKEDFIKLGWKELNHEQRRDS